MGGNSTCPLAEVAPIDPVPFYSHGDINFKAHDVGWLVCTFFSIIATVASGWLIYHHLKYYTCPQQQRHIIRMLFMPSIFSIMVTLSYVFFKKSIYYTTLCDCYEAVVITSFFNLTLQYVGDTPAEQLEVFRRVKITKWFFPLNFWRYRPQGVHFFWLMKVGILQYAVLQPICTLIAVGLQYYGLYCLESWEPYFGHFYISLIVAISISVAMYCIIQIYLPITEEIKRYKPILKFLAVKAVIFLTFWQNSFLSLLIYFKVIKRTEYFTTGDIQVGINAILVTFEMMVFTFVHIKAFTYVIYRPQDKQRTTRRGRALLDVLDFRDWWADMMNTSRYVAARSIGEDYTIIDDIRNQKHMHLINALERNRMSHLKAEQDNAKLSMPTFWKEGYDGKAVENEKLMSDDDLEKSKRADAQEYVEKDDCVRQGLYDSKEEDHPSLKSFMDHRVVYALPFASYDTNKEEVDRNSNETHENDFPSHNIEDTRDETTFHTAKKGHDRQDDPAVTRPALRRTRVDGKRISLRYPPRLSNADKSTFQLCSVTTSEHVQQVIVGSASSISSGFLAKIREAVPTYNAPDDPEAEPINRAGTVVVGAQSWSQTNAQRRQREEEKEKAGYTEAEKMKHRVPPGRIEVSPEGGTAARISSTIASNGMMYSRTRPTRHSIAAGGINGRPSLEVGSVISRQELLDLTTLPVQAFHLQDSDYHRDHHRNILSQDSRPLPLHQQPRLQTLRHLAGQTAVYVRHTEESIRQPQQPTGQSRVQSRRRDYDTPPGFQIDYID